MIPSAFLLLSVGSRVLHGGMNIDRLRFSVGSGCTMGASDSKR